MRAVMDPNAPPDEEPPMEISPEADAAMQELVELFSDPSLRSKARLRCPVEGPDESMFYLSRSLMTNSAMIQIANTSNGSDVYIASVLFREFLMIGKT
jgi:hypothetical protein